jgi:inosose dehydratase
MTQKLAFNPLPFFLTKDGYHPDKAPPYSDMLKVIQKTGYDGVHAEIPADMTLESYLALLHDHELMPAPGYHQCHFSRRKEWPAIIEVSKKLAHDHAKLGLRHVFLAEHFEGAPARFAQPALGVDFDRNTLSIIIDGIGATAEAMVKEGVTPCLHLHAATLVETVEEAETIIAAIPENILKLGPDTGHIAWTGADPVAFFKKHRARIAAIHIKDIRLDVAKKARDQNASYFDTWGMPLWTEPGRGDVDFPAVFKALGKFDGWYIVEVDVADQPTVEASAEVSIDYLRRLI